MYKRQVPDDAGLKGRWWELFQDPDLNPLVERALANNQNLRVAATRLEQARDEVTVTQSAFYPQLGLTALADRSKTSAERPLAQYSEPNYSCLLYTSRCV